MSEEKLKAELMKGDFIVREEEDAYVKMIRKNEKKDLILKVGMGTFYVTLLIASLFIV